MTYEQWKSEHDLVYGPKIVRAVLDNPEMSKRMTWGDVKKEKKNDNA